MSRGDLRPVLAGLVAAVVGFASTFAVALPGLARLAYLAIQRAGARRSSGLQAGELGHELG